MFEAYFPQFLTIAFVHLLAVASPGPDFAIVLRQSVTYGRKTALWTSVGVGTGIFLHVCYSLMGIGVIVSQSVLAFTVLKFAGAAYLAYIGWKALRAQPSSRQVYSGRSHDVPKGGKAFWTGFLTNGLNPKATLFFLSLFTVVIVPGTPLAVQVFYGVYMAFATALWFAGVSVLFGNDHVRAVFFKIGHWFERMMGGILLLLGIKLVFSSQK
ncbi:MAG: LysE family transporter [Desulfopila sp.]|nr:LysE family transporter [Desulfopila sp.]